MGERPVTLHSQCVAQYRGGNEGVAVAVATDPAADPQEGRQLRPVAVCRKVVFEPAVQAGQLRQEGVVVVGQAVGDFVGDRELGRPQHPRLPQGQHAATQRLVVVGCLVGR